MIVSQNTSNAQDVIAKTLREMPVVFVKDSTRLYIPITEPSEELASFLSVGKTATGELRVFPQKREQELVNAWEKAGLSVTYHHQTIEYMGCRTIIAYPQVNGGKGSLSISLTPWFMLPGRPYPIFVYLYMICHYINTGQESQKDSAAAAGELFGIDQLNKSTVCRSLKAMKQFFGQFQDCKPLAVEGTGAMLSDEEIIDRIPEILNSPEELEELFDGGIQRLPAPINRKEDLAACAHALGNIPQEYVNVIKKKVRRNNGPRDTRVRQARPNKKGPGRVQREKPPSAIKFAEPKEIPRIRIGFIAACMHMVFDAATTYHRFLL
jgi:hypothetical protein